jgi:hypothetical protein
VLHNSVSDQLVLDSTRSSMKSPETGRVGRLGQRKKLWQHRYGAGLD